MAKSYVGAPRGVGAPSRENPGSATARDTHIVVSYTMAPLVYFPYPRVLQ